MLANLTGRLVNPGQTRATVLGGGWVRTGDLGCLDHRGQLLFLGRIKDMLKVGGENVFPARGGGPVEYPPVGPSGAGRRPALGTLGGS